MGVSSIQVAIGSVRDKGSLEGLRDAHTWRRVKSKGQRFGEGFMTRGAGGRRSTWGNRKRTFGEVGEMARMCSIDEVRERISGKAQ